MVFDFESLLKESANRHGHLCPGQILGVRMSMFGLEKIDLDPRVTEQKNLIVFVEIDRCATDAIQSVTGCSLGHRTMKFVDYGKMAASFINLKTGKSVRVIAREDARGKAKDCFPGHDNKYAAQLEAYRVMPDEELFDWHWVEILLDPQDMPGRPLKRVECNRCGEQVQDMREVHLDGAVLCRSCAEGAYYKDADKRGEAAFLLSDVMQKSHNAMKIRSKIWIEIGGEPVFGRGRRFLLEAIEKHGSINQAARMVKISYKKAWSHIKAMEERLGIKLVECRTGGKSGGGARLTGEAREFLEQYETLERGINEFVDVRFEKTFKSLEQEVADV
ncbi:MAG: FmdE family protein [Dissulfurispiraceae bacterium]